MGYINLIKKAEQIAKLNDCLRITGDPSLGKIILTSGVSAYFEDKALKFEVVKLLKTFNKWDDDDGENDPYGEHDFGSFTDSTETKFFFKIDYYDKAMTYLSECPEDKTKTVRVLTLMLASEY